MRKYRFAGPFVLATFVSLTTLLIPAGARQDYDSPRRQEYGSEGAGRVDRWPLISPEGESFSIRMPYRPKLTTRKIPTGKGKPVLLERTYMTMGPVTDTGAGRDEVAYFVSSTGLPGAAAQNGVTVVKREELDKVMYTLQQSFERGLQAAAPDFKLADAREVISGLYTGREYEIEKGYMGSMGRIRFFATARNIYLVGYIRFTYHGIAYLNSFTMNERDQLVVQ